MFGQSFMADLERGGFTREQGPSFFQRAEDNLRGTQFYQPDLRATELPDGSYALSSGGEAVAGAAGPVVLALAPFVGRSPWEAVWQRDADFGRAGGLVEGRVPGYWHCPWCDASVPEGACERHVESGRHMRAKAAQTYMQDIAEKYRRGELPPFIELKNGVEYCTLCWAYATEGHLLSQRHISHEEHWRQSVGMRPAPMLALTYSGEASAAASSSACAAPVGGAWMCAGVAAPAVGAPEAPALPPDWGSPLFYRWRPELGCFYCKLCWKNADESHVSSDRHRYRMANPLDHLEEPEDIAAVRQWLQHQGQHRQLPAPAASSPWASYNRRPPPPPPRPPPPALEDLQDVGAAAYRALCAATCSATPLPHGDTESAQAVRPVDSTGVVAPQPPREELQPEPEPEEIGAAAAPATTAAPVAGSGRREEFEACAVREYSAPATERGYLSLALADPVRVSYEGVAGDEAGWSYGRAPHGSGWFPSNVVARMVKG